jgi:diaminopimelate epimerase
MTEYIQVIPFVKACACGNDFLIIDGSYVPPDIADFSKRICDRHRGVGADGVEWIFSVTDADVQARLFNADGSEAEISGNGTRCVAAYLASKQAGEKFTIRTGAGIKVCALNRRSENRYDFEIAMGKPEVGDQFSLNLSFGEVQGTPVSMGNPHYVIFVDDFSPQWQMQAKEIGSHATFKEGVNVELAMVRDAGNIEVRFFERGVGETQSSGTGSCASAAAAISEKRAQSPVQVHAPGGTQIVRWDDQIFLRGSAELVCSGEYFG